MNIIIRIIKKLQSIYYASYSKYHEYRYSNEFCSMQEIAEVIQKNRESISIVNDWIDDNIYENSVFRYGLPENLKPLINKPIDNNITYTDIICFLQTNLTSKINYLELGVSVGKNFFQICRFLQNSRLTGFDLENINPTLEDHFSNKDLIAKWKTFSNSLKQDESTFSKYRYSSNDVYYLSGDIFDEESWKNLKGQKYNIIFSDAFHSPDALEFEFKMLLKYELIDTENFILIWDDLGGPMTKQFIKIYKSLSTKLSLNKNNLALNRYNGWLGNHECKHLIGIIWKIADIKKLTSFK